MARLRLPGEWQSCAYAFLQSLYDLSGSDQSLYSYHGILTQFFASGLHPEQVTKTDVEAFITRASQGRGREGRAIAPATRNHRLCVLTSFYRFASTYTAAGAPLYQKSSPTLGIAYSRPDVKYKALSSEEIKRFFAVIPATVKGARDRAIFLTYIYTARRRSELLRLRVSDITLSSLVDADGTRRACPVYEFSSKGRSREMQRAELPAPAWAAIQEYWRIADRGERPPEDEPVFAVTKRSGSGGRKDAWLNGDYVNLVFKDYCKQAGLSSALGIHALRHASARERYNAGQGVIDIQRLLGHSSLGTTQVYLTRLSGVSDPGAKLLEQRLGAL